MPRGARDFQTVDAIAHRAYCGLHAHESRVQATAVVFEGRGEDVDPSEYTFRAVTQLETAAPKLDWLNKGVFISVGGRQAAGVVYETYLVG